MKSKQDLELLSKLAASAAEVANTGETAMSNIEKHSKKESGYFSKLTGTSDQINPVFRFNMQALKLK